MVRVAAIVGRSGRLDNSACSWNATLDARQSSLQLQLRSVFRHPLSQCQYTSLRQNGQRTNTSPTSYQISLWALDDLYLHSSRQMSPVGGTLPSMWTGRSGNPHFGSLFSYFNTVLVRSNDDFVHIVGLPYLGYHVILLHTVSAPRRSPAGESSGLVHLGCASLPSARTFGPDPSPCPRCQGDRASVRARTLSAGLCRFQAQSQTAEQSQIGRVA